MISRRGVIYDSKNRQHEKSYRKKPAPKFEDASGDSGVGQAPEFPFASSKRRENKPPQHTTDSLRYRSVWQTFTSPHTVSKIGTILIFFSLFGFLYSYWPIIKTELGYRITQATEEELPSETGRFTDIVGETLLGDNQGIPDSKFSIIIPKIHAKARVIADVNPASESEYFSALAQGVAHAKGTLYPGENGTIYLFAHSTDSPANAVRYNAVFYLLRELGAGDEVELYFNGVKHRYSVVEQKIVDPTDVSYLTPYNSENKERLILQTCWPPGTRLKRLLIFAEKVGA